ncbi:hypothetical protein ACHAWF_006129 [Thalassiosira exigua]
MKIQAIVLSALGIFASVPALVGAHTRFECPPPRSGETGVKQGPCDAQDDPSLPAYPLIPGALNTITWLESVPHPGAPARIALSMDGDDSVESFESCLLLDHIPHDEYSSPKFMNPTSWHRSSITIWVPDVYCERCHLQLMTVMSDEIHRVPEDTSCVYGGAKETNRVGDASLPACPVVYHSCAPVSINGATPRNDIAECNTAEFEAMLDWPRKPSDSDVGYYDHSTYYYKGDPGLYNPTTSRLTMAGSPIKDCNNFFFCDPEQFLDVNMIVPGDAKYTDMEGTCAAMVNMQVEDFVMGQLPSTPRDPSTIKVPGPCDSCAMMDCYSEGACSLRDPVTGNWTGQAEMCSMGPPACEACFPDSPCFGYGSSGEAAAIGDASAATTDGQYEPMSNTTTTPPPPPPVSDDAKAENESTATGDASTTTTNEQYEPMSNTTTVSDDAKAENESTATSDSTRSALTSGLALLLGAGMLI